MLEIHDISRALADRAEEICAELLPNGKRVGRKWICGDVMGSAGESMEVELDGPKQGVWYDHASQEGGDMIDLVAANKILGKGKAAAWGRTRLGLPNDYAPDKTAFDPLAMRWMDKKTGLWVTGAAAWPYHDAAGTIFAYVVRFNFDDGRKDILPLRMIDGEWKWKGWKGQEKRPLFNAHKLAAQPEAPVLVVEGEKTAAAAQKLFQSHVATTCQGGAGAFQKADWSAIAERKEIILWPDADASGKQAMAYLKARFPNAKVVNVAGLPDGWDLADPVPEGFSVQGMFDGAGTVPVAAVAPAEPMPQPFRCLGHTDDGFFYLSHLSGRVEHLTAAAHTELPLQVLAPDQYWIDHGYYQKTGDVDWKRVAKFLLSEQWKVGVFNHDRVRGLGCWLERRADGSQSTVYHAGDHLIVDGVRRELFGYESSWIYPQRTAIDVDVSSTATVEDLLPLLEMCDLLPWQTEGTGWMLAALCFIAPICGALPWRPAGWLIGEKGTGKSYTSHNIITPLIGHCINALSSTTSAGLRQVLQCDAIPVNFDEIEAKDRASTERVSHVLELVRCSSTETGGSIYKGSPGGDAQKYTMRSIFIFSSIAFGAVESADESRIVRFEFRKSNEPEKFARVQALAARTTLDRKFAKSVVSRAIRFAGEIRKAAERFTEAIRKASGDGRIGQQYGALAAGFWFLRSDRQPTDIEIADFAAETTWGDLAAASAQESDPGRASDILLQARVELMDNEGHTYRHNVGELLDLYYAKTVKSDYAWDALMRIGIHPIYDNGDCIDIANRHTELQKIFCNTQFADRWKDYFSRVEGAQPRVYTPRGAKTIKCIRVPKSAFISPEQGEFR